MNKFGTICFSTDIEPLDTDALFDLGGFSPKVLLTSAQIECVLSNGDSVVMPNVAISAVMEQVPTLPHKVPRKIKKAWGRRCSIRVRNKSKWLRKARRIAEANMMYMYKFEGKANKINNPT